MATKNDKAKSLSDKKKRDRSCDKALKGNRIVSDITSETNMFSGEFTNSSSESLNLSDFSTTMTLEDFEKNNNNNNHISKPCRVRNGNERKSGDELFKMNKSNERYRSNGPCMCGEPDCELAGGGSEVYEVVHNQLSKSREHQRKSQELNEAKTGKPQAAHQHANDIEKRKRDKTGRENKARSGSNESVISKESLNSQRKRMIGSKEFINLHAIYSSRAYWTRATNALTELQYDNPVEMSQSGSSKSSMISKRDRLNTSLIDNERNDNHPVEASMSGIENYVEYRSSFNSLFNNKDVFNEMRLENLDRLRGLPTDPFVFLEHANDVRFLNRLLKPFQLYVFMTEYMYGYYDMDIGESNLSPKRIQLDEILWDTLAPLIPILCRQVVETILYKESVVVSATPPCIILGDIHGNLNDVWYIHQHFISNPDYADYKFVFLGDYVDRGAKSVEVIVFLFLLKCIDPSRFILLRGNHEVAKINQKYGFKAVVKRIFGCSYLETPGVLCDLIYQSLNLAFDNLPLGCEIRKDKNDPGVFCCHGGIPNSQLREKEGAWLIEELNQLGVHGLKPHCLIPARNSTKQVLAMNEILWNDPMPDKIHAKKPNKAFHRNKKRGGHCSYFSQKAVDEFMNANNFFAIVRGHQFKQTKDVGFSFQFDQKVVTVFSGSNYCGNERNATGYCLVEPNGDISANTLRTAEQTEPYRNLNRFLLEIDPKTKEPKYCIF